MFSTFSNQNRRKSQPTRDLRMKVGYMRTNKEQQTANIIFLKMQTEKIGIAISRN
jgi:hypothetical protein